MKNTIFTILLSVMFALSACSSATNETANSNIGKLENANAGKTEVKKTVTNKSAEVSKNSNANSETNKSSELVKCGLTKFPSVKGFSLGQTVDEINANYPFFKKGYEAEKEKELEDRKKANFVLMTLGSSFTDEETRGVSEFEGVSFIWHFLDEKLMALVVKYQDDETSKIDKVKPLVEKIATKYDLPKEGWKFDEEEGAELTCQGFKVDVSNNYKNGPTMMITDLTLEKESKKRGL